LFFSEHISETIAGGCSCCTIPPACTTVSPLC